MISRAELKQQAKAQLKGNIGSFFICHLAYFGIAMALSFLTSFLMIVPVLGLVAAYVVMPPLIIGYYMLFLEVTYGDKPKAGTLLKGYKNCFGSSVFLYLLVLIFTFLWSLLLVIPGIIKTFSYSMSWYILAEKPYMTAREALNESKEIMDGHKMELFVLYLSFIPWILLCYVTLGIAMIYVIPYMQLTMANFYHNIKPQETTSTYETPVAEVIE